MKRKLAAIVLAIAMVFTMMPMTSYSVAYADDAVINFNLTDTDLEWDPVDGAAFYQINILGQWMQDEDGGPNYIECSFPRQKIDKYIIEHVFNYNLEPEDTYKIYIEAVGSDDSLIETIEVDYPSPLDGMVKNVRKEGNWIYWDEYCPGTYYMVYVNDIFMGQGSEIGDNTIGIDLEDTLYYMLDWGEISKPEDDTYTFRIDDMMIYDGEEKAIASWEGDFTYTHVEPETGELTLELDESTGTFSWYGSENVAYVRFFIYDENYNNGPLTDYIEGGTGSVDTISDAIDDLIKNNYITKKNYYSVAVKGYNASKEQLAGCSSSVNYEYQSSASPDELPSINAYINEETHTLIWEPFSDDVYQYKIYVSGLFADYLDSSWTSVNLESCVDYLVGDGQISKADAYPITLYAVSGDYQRIAVWNGSLEYETEVYEPIYAVVDDYGILTWNEIPGTAFYNVSLTDADGTPFARTYYEYPEEGVNVKDFIRNLIEDEEFGFVQSEDSIYYGNVDAYDENGRLLTSSFEQWEYYYTLYEPFRCRIYEGTQTLTWSGTEGGSYIKVCFNDNYFSDFISVDAESVDLAAIIDRGIINNELDKADIYEITVYLYDDEESHPFASYYIELKYSSSAVPNPLPEINVALDPDTGELTWEWLDGSESYKLYISGYEHSGRYWENENIQVKDIIDSLIECRRLEKSETGDYVITLLALNENSKKVGKWEETLHYESEAEPIPYVEMEAGIDPDGILTWTELDNISSYKVYIYGNDGSPHDIYNGEYPADGIPLKDKIDKLVRETPDFKYYEESYQINIVAYAFAAEEVSAGHWTGYFEYLSPYEYQPPAYINVLYFDGESGQLSWETPEGADVDHYVIYVENYGRRITDFTGQDISMPEVIEADGYFGDGSYMEMYIIGEDADGVMVAKSEYLYYNYHRPVVQLTADDVYINSDGYLVANPYEGADYYEFIIFNTDEEGNKYYKSGWTEWDINGFDYFDVNKEIDRLIWNDPGFVNSGMFDVEFQVGREDYGTIAKREWQYEYSSDKEYHEPDSLDLWIEDGWLRTDYTDADFRVNVTFEDGCGEGSPEGYGELQFFIAGWMNNAIEEGKIEEGSTNTFEVEALRDGFIVAKGTLSLECHQTDTPEFKGLTLDRDTGMLSWDEVYGVDNYYITIDGNRVWDTWDEDANNVDIYSLIDGLINNEEIEKSDSYEIVISAERGNFILAESTYTFMYDSPANPPAKLEASITDGILSWEPVDGAYEYAVEISKGDDCRTFNVEQNTSVNINQLIDMLYTADRSAGDSDLHIRVYAYDYDYLTIAKFSEEYEYTPKAYIPEEVSGLVYDEAEDSLTWNKVDGADGYVVYVNGSHICSCYYMPDKVYNIKRSIDSRIRREELERPEDDRYEITVKAILYSCDDLVTAEGIVEMIYDSPATPPIPMEASIDKGILSWEPVEGAYGYEVEISNWGGDYSIETRGTQVNIEQLADLLYSADFISNDRNLNIRITAHNNEYDPLGRWSERYTYTPKETVPEDITGIKYNSKDGSLTWNKADGVEGYFVYINGENLGYYDNDENQADIERLIDRNIRLERLDPSDNDKYNVTIAGYIYGNGNLVIARGDIEIVYDSPATPPVEMDAEIDENGIFTWGAIDGTEYYNVSFHEFYSLSFDACSSVYVNDIIDKLVARDMLRADNDYYYIWVTAYNEYGEPLGRKTIKYEYTPNEYEETVVTRVDITDYINDLYEGDIVPRTARLTQAEPANAKDNIRIDDQWYYIIDEYDREYQYGDEDDRIPLQGDKYEHELHINAELGYKFSEDLVLTINGEAVDPKTFEYYGDYLINLYKDVIVQPSETSISDVDEINILGGPFTYTGEAIEPEIELVHKGRTLIEDTDYSLSYSNNTNAGTATITIKGLGRFSGTATTTFTIAKASQTITAKAKASTIFVGKSTGITVSGAKEGVTYKSSDTKIATVTTKGVVKGVKAGTVKITVTTPGKNYVKNTKTVTIKVVPASTTSLTAANQATGVKLTWKKITGVTGYKVYRGSTLLKKITSASTVTYTDTKANTNGTKYTFKVVPYISTVDGTAKSVTTYRVSRPAISSLTNSATRKMTVKWGKNTKATGYEIWYSTSKAFSTKKTATVTKNTTVSKTITSLTKGKTYYVKVRSYKTVSGKKYYSAWSVVKTVKITK